MRRHPVTALLAAALILAPAGAALAQGDAAEGKAIAFDRGRATACPATQFPAATCRAISAHRWRA